MTRQYKSNNRAKMMFIFLAVLVMSLLTSCTYMKMNPPPDTDKANLAGNNSCWLATAANMLAGAGYGNGASVQARAEDIYSDLTGHFGIANGGWTDTALSWWLGSANNVWPGNPYTVVTVYGNKIPKYPWSNNNGAKEIANNLRKCNFVGLSISWPTNAIDINGNPVIGSGGHAITGWGDRSHMPWKGYSDPVSGNPSLVRLTDSDRETGGDVQQYDYDSYTSPNPGGANEGNGWYVDYDGNHPYIKHIVTLSPTMTAGGSTNIQRVIGSYKIYQDKKLKAIDLHYDVGTDTEILTYNTRVSCNNDMPPVIQESQPQRTELDVDWDFRNNPIPGASWVTITTEFILRNWNAMKYDNVHFTYPDRIFGKVKVPISWKIESSKKSRADKIPNVTGGYIVASFDIIDISLPEDKNIVGKYRLIHQYSYTQSPEQHTFTLDGLKGYQVTNLSFGHTYGLPDDNELWEFKDWMTVMKNKRYIMGDKPLKVNLDWSGRLPYPEGEDIKGRVRDIKKGLMMDMPKRSQ